MVLGSVLLYSESLFLLNFVLMVYLYGMYYIYELVLSFVGLILGLNLEHTFLGSRTGLPLNTERLCQHQDATVSHITYWELWLSGPSSRSRSTVINEGQYILVKAKCPDGIKHVILLWVLP